MDEVFVVNFLQSEGGELEKQFLDPVCVTTSTLDDLLDEIKESNGEALITKFGTISELFDKAFVAEEEILKTALEVVKGAFDVFLKNTQNKNDFTSLEREEKQLVKKMVSVLIFLCVKIIGGMESRAEKDKKVSSVITSTHEEQPPKKKSKKTEQEKVLGRFGFWPSELYEITTRNHKMLEKPLEILWRGNTEFSTFIRGLILTYATVIRNYGDDVSSGDPQMNIIFKILEICAVRYGEQKTMISRIVPMLRHGEKAGQNIAEGINIMASLSGNGISLVFDAFNSAVEQTDYLTDGKDTKLEKGLASFISLLCRLNPEESKNSLSFITYFLEVDSPVIRGAVLQSLKDILSFHVQKKKDDKDDPMMRDDVRTEDSRTFVEETVKLLVESMRDVNANVRSKALQYLAKLVADREIEEEDCLCVMENLNNRIWDKALTVRKHAIQLIHELIKRYPVTLKFDQDQFEQELLKKHKELAEYKAETCSVRKLKRFTIIKDFMEFATNNALTLEKKKWSEKVKTVGDITDTVKDLLKNDEIWEATSAFYYSMKNFDEKHFLYLQYEHSTTVQMIMVFFDDLLEEQAFDRDDEPLIDAEIPEHAIIENEKMLNLKGVINYLGVCKKMGKIVKLFQRSMSKILADGTPSDKNEVISVISTMVGCGYFPTPEMTESIVEAVTEKTGRKSSDLLQSFIEIFFPGNASNIARVKSLIRVTQSVSSTHKDHLTTIIVQLHDSEFLNKEVVQIVWDAFVLSSETWTQKDARSAAYIIGALASHTPSVLTSNLSRVIEEGLGHRGMEDMHFANCTCEAILKVYDLKDSDFEDEKKRRCITLLPEDHELFEKLVQLLEYGLMNSGNEFVDEIYPELAESCLRIIYRLSYNPKFSIDRFVTNAYHWVFGRDDTVSQIQNTERLFSRYLSAMAALLAAHINYYESYVLPDIKARQKITTRKRNAEEDQKRLQSGEDVEECRIVTENGEQEQETNDNDGIGHHDVDIEGEQVRLFIESLLNSGTFRQLRVVSLLHCRSIQKFQSTALKMSAVKATVTLMFVTSKATEKTLEMLKNCWNEVSLPSVKIEIIRAAMLLNVRFPNQMEPFNEIIKLGLQDECEQVRMSCLDFIIFLSLCDLVKVKELLAEMAACMSDQCSNVKSMAQDFFNECSEKENMLSNALLDIIARLSQKQCLPVVSFQEIIRYLILLVKKDKQVISLIEKIMQRFHNCEDERMNQDTAFCLSLFSYNEKSFKILKDNFSMYCDRLDNTYVYEVIKDICKALSKTLKGENKTRLEEYEREVDEIRDKFVNNIRIQNIAERNGNESDDENVNMSDSEPEENLEDAEKTRFVDPATSTDGENEDCDKENGESESGLEMSDSEKENGHNKGHGETEASSDDEIPASNEKRRHWDIQYKRLSVRKMREGETRTSSDDN